MTGGRRSDVRSLPALAEALRFLPGGIAWRWFPHENADMAKRMVLVLLVLAGCPSSQNPRDHRTGAGISPDACGKIDTSKVGRKLYAFLVASAELDRASVELENSVRDSCRKMA